MLYLGFECEFSNLESAKIDVDHTPNNYFFVLAVEQCYVGPTTVDWHSEA
jgi:hypothetical protein